MTDAGIYDDGVAGIPWPGTLSRRMARILWGRLAPFANMSEAEADAKLVPLGFDINKHTGPYGNYMNLRRGLHELAAGRWRHSKAIQAAPLCLIESRGRLSWGLRHVDPLQVASAEALSVECWFLLGLLALPEVRPLLTRCATCGLFRLARARRRQKKGTRQTYCSRACRQQAASPADNARRQREYRSRAFS